MTKLNVTKVLAGAVTAATITIALSGNALAGNVGGDHVGGTHLTQTNNVIKTTEIGDHDRDRDRRHFRFYRFGSIDLDYAPVCFYKWTWHGKVRICPDLDY